MTTTTKERVAPHWNQAKEEGKQRASRIREILQQAASASFAEVKVGASELHGLTRKSVSEWLEELNQNAEAEGPTVTNATAAPTGMDAEASTTPTWRDILMQSVGVVGDRKGDWFQQAQDHWNEQTTKFDADMNKEYGDRYQKAKSVFKTLFQKLSDRVKAARQAQSANAQSQAAQPINIEVLDGQTPVASTEGTVESI